MEELKKAIQEKRPQLSASSLTTYASILKNLHKKIFNSVVVNLDDFKETDKVFEFIREIEPRKRKSILSALVVLTENNDYREKMMQDINAFNKEIAKQEMTDTQRKNWITTEEITRIFNNLKLNAEPLFKKEELSKEEYQIIQNYVLVCLLGGIFIAPRRNLDYTEFRVKNIEPDKDNYFEKNKLIFNTYKTAKTYGRQCVDIPSELKSILKKWDMKNPNDYLLWDSNGNKLTSVKLNQRLNKIFNGRKIGVNNLRHCYLTDRYKDISIANKKMQQDMYDMGSSIVMANTYIKLN